MITEAKRERLRPLLIKAYWRADTAREFAAVRLLWMLCGLEDPLFGDGVSAKAHNAPCPIMWRKPDAVNGLNRAADFGGWRG